MASSCRDGGIRTHDLQHPMLARYRATLHPELMYGRVANIIVVHYKIKVMYVKHVVFI